jgi:Protein of unknown function (DUF1552)
MKLEHRSRRQVLKGIGGTVLGLPLLDVFSPRRARADGRVGEFALFVVGCNGVMQAYNNSAREPEMFWPRAAGPLTRESMSADLAAKRSTGELAEHADRLLMIKGIKLPFRSSGDSHNSADCQILTAQQNISEPVPTAFGESIDNRIAREKNPPGREPLVLRVIRGPHTIGAVSYGGRDQQRFGDDSPITAYERMVGLVGTDPALAASIQKRRLSVNDLVRSEMKRLLARADLSTDDRRRLDGHFSAIRDIEVKLTGALAPEAHAALKEVGTPVGTSPKYYQNEYAELTIGVQMDLMAFAVSGGYTRTAVLKIGDRADNYAWNLPGFAPINFHKIAHRSTSGLGDAATRIENAVEMHHLIDRIYMRLFKRFLDRLANTATPRGPLIDQGFAAYTNQNAVGWHNFSPIPWIIAGGAGGYLTTGRFLQLENQSTNLNLLLNSLLGAVGVTKPDGAPLDDFGSPDLAKGRLTEILAPA